MATSYTRNLRSFGCVQGISPNSNFLIMAQPVKVSSHIGFVPMFATPNELEYNRQR